MRPKTTILSGFKLYLWRKSEHASKKMFPPTFPPTSIMATTFILKKKSKTAVNSYIQIAVRFRGQLYKRTTGETIPVKYWNAKKRRCSMVYDFPRGWDVNDVLDKMEATAGETVRYFRDYASGIPPAVMFWKKFDELYYKGGKYVTTSITEYLAECIDKMQGTRSDNTIKSYVTVLHKLTEYEDTMRRKLQFADIDMVFYDRLQKWMYMRGLSENYFGVVVRVLKSIINKANYEGLCDLKGIKHPDFVAINNAAENIYLSFDELRRIYELEITPESIRAFWGDEIGIRNEDAKRKAKSLRIVRDRFIIGAFTGLRVSDYGRLSAANLTGNTIRIKTTKTGANVVIPIHPYVRTILSNGFDFGKTISEQTINRHIKEIARMAGIDEEVTINRNIGGRNVQETHKKYELVCSHTARRSFATNAYKAGIPSIAIMKITGHTRESTFLRYIKVSAEENAAMLEKHPFFNME